MNDTSGCSVLVPHGFMAAHAAEITAFQDDFPDVPVEEGTVEQLCVRCPSITPAAKEILAWFKERIGAVDVV